MSNPKFSCIIPGCTKTTAAHHIIKHILSHQPSEVKGKLGGAFGLGVRGSLIRINMKLEGVANNFQACLGCNKVFRKIPLQVAHLQSCPNKEKHKEVCKSFITSEAEATPTPVAVESSEDMSKLKKRITSLESNLKSAEKIVDESEDISQAFIELLQRLQEDHKDIFIEQMGRVRYGRPEVYRKVCEDLDIEEGIEGG
jgi:hypothetical protein